MSCLGCRVAIVVLLTLGFAGCGGESGPVTSRPQAVKRVASVLKSAASAIRTVKDNASAEEAAKRVAEAADAIDAIGATVRNLPAPDEAELAALDETKAALEGGTKAMTEAVETVSSRIKAEGAPKITSATFSLELMRLQLSVSEFALSLNPADAKALNRARDAAGLGRNGPPPAPTGPSPQIPPPMLELPPEARMSLEERVARFRAQHGEDKAVVIHLNGLPPERALALTSHVKTLAGATASMHSTRDGRTVIAVAPVEDLGAFYAAIDFGAVGPLTGREFEVDVDVAKLPGGP